MLSNADLPQTEDELFALDAFPLLDIPQAIENLGNEPMVHNMLQLMVESGLPADKATIQAAYADKNWELVEKTAHKMKSGALYCGAMRLKYACQYLERSQKAGLTKFRAQLYHQLIHVLDETSHQVTQWLHLNKHQDKTTKHQQKP